MSASSGLGFGSGTSVSLTPGTVPESIRYARMFLPLDRALPCLIAHTDTGGPCARCCGDGILLVHPEGAVKSRCLRASLTGAARSGDFQKIISLRYPNELVRLSSHSDASLPRLELYAESR